MASELNTSKLHKNTTVYGNVIWKYQENICFVSKVKDTKSDHVTNFSSSSLLMYIKAIKSAITLQRNVSYT